MVLLVGQVPRDFMDREAQQEIEYRRMMGPLAKWVALARTSAWKDYAEKNENCARLLKLAEQVK